MERAMAENDKVAEKDAPRRTLRESAFQPARPVSLSISSACARRKYPFTHKILHNALGCSGCACKCHGRRERFGGGSYA